MKMLLIFICLSVVLSGCNSSNISFDAIKVFDNQFEVTLSTNNKLTIKSLKRLFNNKTEQKGVHPNFRYLIEFKNSNDSERWRYSSTGYIMKYSQEDQRIYAVIKKDELNKILKIKK